MMHLVAVHHPVSAFAISPCETPCLHRSLKGASFQNCFPSKVRLKERIMTIALSSKESSLQRSLACQVYFYLSELVKTFVFQKP